MFDTDRTDLAERRARLASVLDRAPAARADRERSVLGEDSLAERARPALVGDAVPVLDPLAGVLPQGLRRGAVASVRTRGQEVDYLALALLAGALGAGMWAAAVGVPELGGVALMEQLAGTAAGARGMDRLLLVPDPGERWAEVLIQLAAGVDAVLVRVPPDVPAGLVRQVDGRLRPTAGGHRAAVVTLGSWPSSYVGLWAQRTGWTGLHGPGDPPELAGTGHLAGGRATIRAEGRATGGRVRSVDVLMPTSSGGLSLAVDEPAAAGPGGRGLTAVA